MLSTFLFDFGVLTRLLILFSFSPIMQRLYGAGGAPGGAPGGFPPGGFPGGAGFPGAGGAPGGFPEADGPSVEEVD